MIDGKEIQLLGIDYSSSANGRVYIAHGLFRDGTLEVKLLEHCVSVDFSAYLAGQSPPLLAAVDFPLGLPLEFQEILGGNVSWEQSWRRRAEEWLRSDLSMVEKDFTGERLRRTDMMAGAGSPIAFRAQPFTGRMFQRGCEAILSVPFEAVALSFDLTPDEPQKSAIFVEAYPRLVAACLAAGSYKGSSAAMRQSVQREIREQIFARLTVTGTSWLEPRYGFAVEIDPAVAGEVEQEILADKKGDALDAILALVQAGWVWQRLKAGERWHPEERAVRTEGWIADPVLLP